MQPNQYVTKLVKFTQILITKGFVSASLLMWLEHSTKSVGHKCILARNVYLILESYLNQRKFFVKYKDETSNLNDISAGVPQGSVLGPILYLLFTADIPLPTAANTMLATFADDTVVVSSDRSIEIATKNLQDAINLIVAWFNEWNLCINEDKSVQVIFTTRNNFIAITVFINGKQVNIEKSAKYLGIQVHLNSKLNYRQHLKVKSKQIQLKLREFSFLIGKNSQHSA